MTMCQTQSTYESVQKHSARLRAIVALSCLVLAWGVAALGQVNVTIFGPATFTRNVGKPQNQVTAFALPPGVIGPFRLVVENGSGVGTNRVSSASVVLNRVEILGPSDFNQQVATIERDVRLLPSNVLQVDL